MRLVGLQGPPAYWMIVARTRRKAIRVHLKGAARCPSAMVKSSVRGISPPHPVSQALGADKAEGNRRRGGNLPRRATYWVWLGQPVRRRNQPGKELVARVAKGTRSGGNLAAKGARNARRMHPASAWVGGTRSGGDLAAMKARARGQHTASPAKKGTRKEDGQ